MYQFSLCCSNYSVKLFVCMFEVCRNVLFSVREQNLARAQNRSLFTLQFTTFTVCHFI